MKGRGLLVILSPGFPSDESDSTCLPFIQHLVRALAAERGHDAIRVVTFQYPYMRSEYVWHGIRVFALGGRNRPGLMRLVTWVRALIVLRRLKPARLLALWLTECGLVARWYDRLKRTPYYIWLQGQDARKGNAYVRRIAPDPARVIAISQRVATELKVNYGITPACVIGNGIDLTEYPALNKGARDIDIIGVGSLIPVKNFRLFIEVVTEVKKRLPGVRAIIIGDGDQRSSLLATIEKAGLQSAIMLEGHLPHAEVLARMNNARLLLHTSGYEGDASVIHEALYSGCAVVSALPLPGKVVEKVTLATDKASMESAVVKFLDNPSAPERILINDVRDSAKAIDALLQ